MFGFLRGKKKVPVVQTRHGSHGDHWRAVFGFIGPDDLLPLLDAIREELRIELRIRPHVTRVRADYGVLAALGIGSEKGLRTVYPALMVSETIPVAIKEIVEWAHVDGVEGQVRGAGRDTFALDFFALDYAENKTKYESGGQLDIALAGMAYRIEPSDDMPDEFSSDFCGYLPNGEMPCGHDFSFVGIALSVDDVPFKGEELKLLRVRLINNPEQPDAFNLPIIANVKNVECDDIQVGDRISGCFWLQGRIYS